MPVQRRWLIGGGAAILASVFVFGFWFAVIRGESPAPVSIEGAVESLSTPADDAGAGGGSTTAEATPTPTLDDGLGLDGDWAVASEGDSFVGYRVKQTVVGVDAPTRVGRTPAVIASLAVAEDTVASLELNADLLQLTSGDERRDVIFADLLETELFPTAQFVLTSTPSLEEVLEAGEDGLVLDARLTLHGVTDDVELALQGSTTDGFLILVGSTEVAFADFGIDRPTVLQVLSIEDRATLELQLVLARQSQ
jgi:polyisoprenoid-binding protein YceI